MKGIINFLVVVIAIIFAIAYIIPATSGETSPRLATWMLFFVAVIFSFITYWSHEKEKTTIGNIANFVDFIFVLIIFPSILFFGENVNFEFNKFEIACLFVSFVIILFWKFTNKHFVSNLMLQVIMTIAYLPTIQSVWNYPNNESLSVWTVWFFGGIIALIFSLKQKNTLGIIYSSRAIILEGIIIFLILKN